MHFAFCIRPEDILRLLAVVKGKTLSKAKDLDREELELTWPELVFRELLCMLGVTLAFILLSLLFNAPLEEQANPTRTPNPAKAPWYFVGLQELLVYFDPWIAGVSIPLLIILGLMAIPYLDSHRQGTGSYALRGRGFALTVFLGGLALWFFLIVVGYFFRGPNWGWYWPWEDWAAGKAVVKARDLPPLEGLLLLLVYFAGGVLLLAGGGLKSLLPLPWRNFRKELGPARFAFVAALLLLMGGVVGKILLRLVLGIKYVLVTPWFHI
ncbi:MAG: cytochrome C [Candidatus Tectomicrobia bacterium]|uniref:Cytochrome C n=1 Tax=Tectimicrobiota bacterium TaxID=2528274 RepID=A0A932FWP3_UNCTE|nr:cytochrome C [Candidatus Tectomicrobia bacterium]